VRRNVQPPVILLIANRETFHFGAKSYVQDSAHSIIVKGRSKMFQRALNLAAIPVLIALFVTPTRFFLELAGRPEEVIFIIGLLWLTLAVAVF